MKRYMMSDIHGFLEAFEAALRKTDLSGKNQLILLGDYIDYGPDGGRCWKKSGHCRKNMVRKKSLPDGKS